MMTVSAMSASSATTMTDPSRDVLIAVAKLVKRVTAVWIEFSGFSGAVPSAVALVPGWFSSTNRTIP